MSGKIALGAVAGLLIGTTGGYLTANSQAKVEVELAQNYQVELANKNNALQMENLSLQRRSEALGSSTYDRQKIISCMFESTTRSNAIRVYLDGGIMGKIQESYFQPLVSVALKSADKSHRTRWSDLSEEALKIDQECLDQAMIRYTK